MTDTEPKPALADSLAGHQVYDVTIGGLLREVAARIPDTDFEPARDLGFPGCQGSHDYPSTGATDCPARTGTTGPVFEYPGRERGRCAVTGGLVYRGANVALRGAYVFSDSCSSELLVGRLSSTGKLEVASLPSGVAPGYGTIASFGEENRTDLPSTSNSPSSGWLSP